MCILHNHTGDFMKTINPDEMKDNTIKMISKDWMLVTVEKDGFVNPMTASWGGIGFLWNKPVATIYLRPTRYTKEILDVTEDFTLNILPKQFRSALDYCGCHSGRDGNKIKETKLSVAHMNGIPWIEQSRLVIFCKKLYAQQLDAFAFTDNKICKQNYRKDDFHTMYISEITKVLVDK